MAKNMVLHAILVFLAISSVAALDELLDNNGLHDVSFTSRVYDSENDETVFTYSVTYAATELDQIVIAFPNCVDGDKDVFTVSDALPEADVTYNQDAHQTNMIAGVLTGVIWDVSNEDQSSPYADYTMTVTVDGHVGGTAIDYAVVYDNSFYKSTVIGPNCMCPAPTPDLVCDAGGPYFVECVQGTARAYLSAIDSHNAEVYQWVAGTTRLDNRCEVVADFNVDSGVCANTTYEVALQVYAGNGLSKTCTSTVTVVDATPPRLSGLDGIPLEGVFECNDVPPYVKTPMYSDNCDTNPHFETHEVYTTLTASASLLMRNWTVTDDCGNTDSVTQSLMIVDTTPPTFNGVEEDVIIAECDDIPVLCAPLAFDNCDENEVIVTVISETVPKKCVHNYHIQYKYIATDAAGNSHSTTRVVQVDDSLAPTLVGIPADTTVQCDAVPAPALVVAVDNCATHIEVDFTETFAGGISDNEYTITREWEAFDECDNRAYYQQNVYVVDNNAPTFFGIGDDITVDSMANVPEVCAVTAEDNCDTTLTIDYISSVTNEVCPNQKTITRTWSVTDDAVNTVTEQQIITVSDTVAPVFFGIPSPGTYHCDNIPVTSGVVTAIDAVDGEVDQDDTDVWVETEAYTKHLECVTLVTRTWTAKDSCSNTDTKSVTFAVTDNTPPTFVGLPQIYVVTECDKLCDVDYTEVTAYDTCTDTVDVVFTETRKNGTCADEYTLYRNWHAVDDCNNAADFTQTVVVHDTSKPTLVGCVGDTEAYCENIPDAPTVLVQDKCDESLSSIPDFYQSSTRVGDENEYVLTRIWSATDRCGNVETFTQVIDVTDNTDPELVGVPDEITIQCDDAVVWPTVNATDNCDDTISVFHYDEEAPGTCDNERTIVRTWIATDLSGHSVNASATINVIDTENPIWVSDEPADLGCVESCEVPEAPVLTFNDTCSSPCAASFSEDITPACCATEYDVTRTWEAKDDCGNSIQESQTFHVRDTKKPILTGYGPRNLYVSCSEPLPVYQGTVVDCEPGLTASFNESINEQSCEGTYKLVRHWWAKDCAGNTGRFTQTVHVSDNGAPVFDYIPEDTSLECDNPDRGQYPNATDECTLNTTHISVTLSTTTVSTTVNDYTEIRDFTATDKCGNQAHHRQIVIVVDSTPPTLSDPEPSSSLIALCDDVPIPLPVIPSDNCDTGVVVHMSEARFGNCDDSYVLVRTWSATDLSGNVASVEQTVTVLDLQPPKMSGLPDSTNVTYDCDVPDPPQVTVDDNCADPDGPYLTLDFSEVRVDKEGTEGIEYTLYRTWLATDGCGNTEIFEQTITAQDIDKPWFTTTPEDTIIECTCTSEVPDVDAEDACDDDVHQRITFSEVKNITGEYTYELYRTWHVCDTADNCADAITQTVTVIDSVAPICETVDDSELLESSVFNMTGEDCTPPDAPTVTCVDTCDFDVPVDYSETRTDYFHDQKYTLIRHWYAEDSAEQVWEWTWTITVQDHEAPTWVGSLPEGTSVECYEIPEQPNMTATDCDEDILYTKDSTSDGTLCFGQHNYTWRACDEEWNCVNHYQEVYWSDSTNPVFSNVPQDTTFECDYDVPDTPDVTHPCQVFYESDVTLFQDFNNPLQDASPCLDMTFERTWSVTDWCSAIHYARQTVTIQDTTPPVFDSVPANFGDPEPIEHDMKGTYVNIWDDGPATALADCNQVEITHSDRVEEIDCIYNYDYIRTWLATDACGLYAEVSTTITVDDTTPPQILETDPRVDCYTPSTLVDIDSYLCSDDNSATCEVLASEVRLSFENANEYTLGRYYFATDECGNTATFEQTICVEDETPPQLVDLIDLRAPCNGIPDVEDVVLLDHWAETEVTMSFTEDRVENVVNPCETEFLILRTWTVEDASGNSASQTQTITVYDGVAPQFVDVDNLDTTVECDHPGPPTLIATHVCAIDDPAYGQQFGYSSGETDAEILYSEIQVPGVVDYPYILDRTWYVETDCGESDTASQTVVVEDNTDPTFVEASSMPDPTTVECDAIPSVPTFHAEDNCDVNDPDVEYTEERDAGSCNEQYELIRDWVAADVTGNKVFHTQTITVEDTTSPTFDMTLDNTWNECSYPDWESVTASDNCDHAVTITRSEESNSDCNFLATMAELIGFGDPPSDYEEWPMGLEDVDDFATYIEDNCYSYVKRTWMATDDCGNTETVDSYHYWFDTADPILINVPEDTTEECTHSDWATVTAEDVCSGMATSLDPSQVKEEGSCDHSYTIYRTWTATDEQGHTTTAHQTITVQDTEEPQWNMEDEEFLALDGQSYSCEAPDVQHLGYSDNCFANAHLTYEFTETRDNEPVDQAFNYTIKRDFYVADDCGNTNTYQRTIYVYDDEAPTWITEPEQSTCYECNDVPAAADPTYEDNCADSGDILMTFTELRTDGSCDEEYTLTRTWNIEDQDGNSADWTQIVTVVDTTPPSINWATLPTDEDAVCPTVPYPIHPDNITDNCDFDIEADFTETVSNRMSVCPDNYYTLTRQWEAFDDCGNSDSYSYQVFVRDDDAPVWNKEETYDLNKNATCDNIPPSDKAIIFGEDACGSSTTTIDECDSNWNCNEDFVRTFTYTSTDACGWSTTVVQTVTVTDVVAPYFLEDLPGDVTVDCNTVPDAVTLSADDNCDTDLGSVAYSYAEVTFEDEGACIHERTIYRQWFVADGCGNSVYHHQTIVVEDVADPTFDDLNLISDQTLECTDELPTSAPTVDDTCQYDVQLTLVESESGGECDLVVNRTWTADDQCGNSATVVQQVFFFDTTDPIFLNAPDENVYYECDDTFENDTVVATDNCDDDVTVLYTLVANTHANDDDDNYIIVHMWTAFDNCGNNASVTQTVHVTDTIDPYFTWAPSNMTEQCDDPSDAAIPTFADNCGKVHVSYIADDDQYQLGCDGYVNRTRTWNIVDDSGNTASWTQYINLVDTEAPEFVFLPRATTIECDEVDLDAHQITDLSVTDNCGQGTLDVDESETRIDGTCDESYMLLREWFATDSCGNDATHEQTVFVVDTTDPVLGGDLAADAVVECDAVPGTYDDQVTVTDNCDDDLTVELITTEVNTCPWITTREWTATDDCGNQAVHTQVLTIVDHDAPVLFGTESDTTVECGNVPDVPTVTASDNCDDDLTVVYAESDPNQDLSCDRVITRTWSVTDMCGNEEVHVQSIIVEDTAAPEFNIDPLPTIEIECDQAWEPCDLEARDLCSDTVTVEEHQNYSGDTSTGHYQITTTYTATDDCGNEAEVSQVVNVQDTHPPLFSRTPGDQTVECDCANFPRVAKLSATDNCCDADDLYVLYDMVPYGTNSLDEYRHVRSWTVSDGVCSASHVQTITVEDTGAPTFFTDKPDDTTVECDAIPEVPVMAALDTCDPEVQIDYDYLPKTITDTCNYTRQHLWKATDRSGNVATHNYTVEVLDTVGPMAEATSEHRCLYPANDLFFEYSMDDILGLNGNVAFWDISDSCHDVTVEIHNCSTAEIDNNGDDFIDQCEWNTDGTNDVLRVQASTDTDGSGDPAAREYLLVVAMTDECDNTVYYEHTILIPHCASAFAQTGVPCQVATEN